MKPILLKYALYDMIYRMPFYKYKSFPTLFINTYSMTFPTSSHLFPASRSSILCISHPLASSLFLSHTCRGSISRPNFTELSSAHFRTSARILPSSSIFSRRISCVQVRHPGSARQAREQEDGPSWARESVSLVVELIAVESGVIEESGVRRDGWMLGSGDGEEDERVSRDAKLSHPW